MKSKKDPASGNTLLAIAQRHGISSATLSRVLNHPEQVRPELRAKALALLAEAGYVAHGAARSLASRKTRTMGALIPTVDSGLFAKLVDGMQQAIHDHGYQLLLACTNYIPDREASEVRALIERGVDGMMLVGRSGNPDIYRLLESKGIPFVTTCHFDGAFGHPTLGWDNVATASRIANYLVDIGHRRLGVIAGIAQHNDRAADRLLGFTRALNRRGLELPPQYVFERPYTVPEARRAMAALLKLPEPPTAVMCGNDILAYGALQECLWQNLKVPEQMSITGFDNIEMAAHCRPGITTMNVPAFELGQRAARMLLAADADTPVESICIDLELIVRDTTAPPAAR